MGILCFVVTSDYVVYLIGGKPVGIKMSSPAGLCHQSVIADAE